MKKIFFLTLLSLVFSCDDSDDFGPKKNEYGTQVLLKDRDQGALLFKYFIFHSITAKDTPYDFNNDENASFDILAQFPECAIDDSYEFQSEFFSTKFIGNQCEAGISPLDGFNNFFIIARDQSEKFRLIINNTEAQTQRIAIENFELYENDEGKRTIVGEWTSFEPAFVFDVVMTEIDRPEL